MTFTTYKLVHEAKYWWKNTKKLLESQGTQITYEVFHITFFDKYFMSSVKNENEIEFLQIK